MTAKQAVAAATSRPGTSMVAPTYSGSRSISRPAAHCSSSSSSIMAISTPLNATMNADHDQRAGGQKTTLATVMPTRREPGPDQKVCRKLKAMSQVTSLGLDQEHVDGPDQS